MITRAGLLHSVLASHMGGLLKPSTVRKLFKSPMSGLKIHSQTILTATVEVMLGKNSATR